MDSTRSLKRILIIDDSPEDRYLYRRLLRKRFADVHFVECESGEDGLAMLREERPQCVLLDYNLPDSDGLELLTEMAAASDRISTAVIMLTGQGDERVAVEAMKRGAQDYLSKDMLDGDRLARAVQNAVDKVALHEELVRKQQELAHKQEQLHEAVRAADAANRAKSLFLANISHDIRTPMNAIMGMAALAMESGPPPEQREYLELILSSARELLALLNDLLDLSKVEAGQIDIEAAPLAPRSMVAEVLRTLEPHARDNQLSVRESYTAEVPEMVVGDSRRLRQVLLNLVDNAFKFSRPGGEVLVRVSVAERRQPGTMLQFEVVDHGIGIPAGDQSRVFEAFQQVGRPGAQQRPGTGLGLAICAQLVALMGGEIRLESEPGEGCAFTFTVCVGQHHGRDEQAPVRESPPSLLPARAIPGTSSRASVRGAADQSASSPANARHVLVVDDNPTNCKVVTRMLEKRGHRVTVAHDGWHALAALAQQAFDAVLMDLEMPVLDGFETTSIIRARERETGQHMFIIALSAHAMKGIEDRCLAAGMDHYLSKPIALEQLIAAVERPSVEQF